VASGHFASPQDVVREGIDFLRAREREHAEWAARVRRAIEIGAEQAEAGQLTDGAQVFDELRRRACRS
jgi:Arc/MetJ-type ribon-helix-helix transcriptional regulator